MRDCRRPERGAAQPAPLTRPIYSASARFPGGTLINAVAQCHVPTVEGFGRVDCAQVQICPQHFYHLDEALADDLLAAFPGTQFRLHASVRIMRPHAIVDASTPATPTVDTYFAQVAALSRRLGASVYSLHAGERRNASLAALADRIRQLQDQMGLSVAVEGLYPNPRRPQLIDSWKEYAWLLESGLCYALDMSHLHIVATAEQTLETGLVRELLASPACLEVHLSDNDGMRDTHRTVTDTDGLWWWPTLNEAHSNAVFFSEGHAS